MPIESTFEPRTVALLGLGEAGSAIAVGLCGDGGWRAAEAGRQVIAIDVALGEGALGAAMAARAEALAQPAGRTRLQRCLVVGRPGDFGGDG